MIISSVAQNNERLFERATPSGGLWKGLRTSGSQITLFNLPFANVTLENAVTDLVEAAQAGRRTTVAFVNAHTINLSEMNPFYTRVLNRADVRYADGSGLAIAARIAGKKFCDNVNGTDMLPLLARDAAAKGLSIYFYGARAGVAEKAAANLLQKFPELRIAGCDHGYRRRGSTDETAAIDRINASGADILLVALGAPEQDIWLAENRDRLKPSVRLGVGGLFDFFAGRVSRAPLFLRRHGMEWLWRLANEPVRLGRRYIVGNEKFLRFSVRRRIWGHECDATTDSHRIRYSYRKILMCRNLAGAGLRRSLDMAIASAGLAVAWPVMLAVAVAIRLESAGPVLFCQTRVGTRGKPFTIYKFRSMYVDAEARHAQLQGDVQSARNIRFKSTSDPRVTRIGRFIRKTSLDELPQLLNVLKGDMAIVGPRPALPSEVGHYSLEHRERLLVKPGITCTWQVTGRADIDFVEQVALDRVYARRRSFSTDVGIILRTIPAVIRARGAY